MVDWPTIIALACVFGFIAYTLREPLASLIQWGRKMWDKYMVEKPELVYKPSKHYLFEDGPIDFGSSQ